MLFPSFLSGQQLLGFLISYLTIAPLAREFKAQTPFVRDSQIIEDGKNEGVHHPIADVQSKAIHKFLPQRE
jgi:hypothetical protein